MSEEVQPGKVVGFSYVLKNEAGESIETSEHPLEYMHGQGNIIPGLERQMEGLKVGESKTIDVEAVDAYGEYDDDLRYDVPRKNFPAELEIVPGMQFQTSTEDGPMLVTVMEVFPDNIVVDGNHDLAGEKLTFDVTISSIREATQQERDHGHVHDHGHDH